MGYIHGVKQLSGRSLRKQDRSLLFCVIDDETELGLSVTGAPDHQFVQTVCRNKNSRAVSGRVKLPTGCQIADPARRQASAIRSLHHRQKHIISSGFQVHR
ncbi:hypothetical protein [Hoeflea sp.]|uniref:hypothetical protein n=1 Tax=Hoeflea sp. TaxID=1940281 RepID=UPI003A923E00